MVITGVIVPGKHVIVTVYVKHKLLNNGSMYYLKVLSCDISSRSHLIVIC